MADGHLTMTRQLCHNTWLVFKLIHKRTHTCLRSLMQANVPNTAALTPEQVDKRDHLQSGGINSTPAHTHHTSMISDEDSGRGDHLPRVLDSYP